VIKFSAHDLEGNQIAGVAITLDTYRQMLQGKRLEIELQDLGLPKCKLFVVAGRNELEAAQWVRETLGEVAHASVDDSLVIRKRD